MRYFILATFLLSLVAVPATAQPPENSWENLKQLQPGHKIKVVDMQFKSWSGKLVSISDEAIIVRREGKKKENTVERANVLRVTDLQRSHRGRNALIGLAAGIAIGAIQYESSDTKDLAPWGVVAFVGGICGGSGAAVGALFPGPRPTLYRASKPPPAPTASNSPGLNAGE